MSNDNIKVAAAAVLSVAVVCSMPLKSDAQWKPKLPIKKENVDNTDKLNDKFSINGLPEYSGKSKFLTGRKYVSQAGPQYQQEFLAMEKSDQILEWYKNALSSYKWEITYSDSNHVTAKKPNGSSVSIYANPANSPEGRSRVKISYHDYNLDKK